MTAEKPFFPAGIKADGGEDELCRKGGEGLFG